MSRIEKFEAISPTPTHGCSVYRVSCKTEEQRVLLAYLQGLAVGQKFAFSKIYPWEMTCERDPSVIHYVSLTGNKNTGTILQSINNTPKICGWMTIHVEKELKSIYLKEITTRHATDASFKKVGSSLHRALLQDLNNNLYGNSIDFIYLIPLDNAAADVYLRWGYQRLHADIFHMFYRIQPEKQKIPDILLNYILKNRVADNKYNDLFIDKIVNRLKPKLQKEFKQRVEKEPEFKNSLIMYAKEVEKDPNNFVKKLLNDDILELNS